MSRSRPAAAPGFSLIELLVVVGIITVLAGLAMPVVGKQLSRVKDRDTRSELSLLESAVEAYFTDTGIFPPTFGDLESNDAAVAGWAGPYATPVISTLPTPELDLSKDAWNRAYHVGTFGASRIVITSAGADGTRGTADDVSQSVDVTPIRRAATVRELQLLNAAILSYNAVHLPGEPLPPDLRDLLDTLVSAGHLPSGATGLDTDGWGDTYVADPPGQSPVVALTSVRLD